MAANNSVNISFTVNFFCMFLAPCNNKLLQQSEVTSVNPRVFLLQKLGAIKLV